LIFIFFSLLKPFERIFDDILEIMRGRPVKPYDLFLIDFLTNFVFIMLTALGLSIQVVKQWRQSERRTLQAETEKAQAVVEKKTAELSFLKAQINPHFLFNTLNNLYSLAIRQSPHTAPSIMKLSNIMRYLTEDVTKEFIPLKRELECIQDYINLQSLRLGENNVIDFEVTGKTDNKKIAPLILMTFIENVFKYGITTEGQAAITIKLFSDKQQITFFCQNSILVTTDNLESSGIGLKNTLHRLELIYPNKHILDIKNDNGLFTVNLVLQN
jgi:LytS/YehU family sensor histidine kinase